MDDELKPCPFCGGKAEEDYAYFDYNYFGVHCVQCDAYVCTVQGDKKDAKQAWNRRTSPMQTIKIKYLRDIQKIEKIQVGDWIDLRAAEDVTLIAGEYKRIPLGVAMELPEGYEAIVAPRSSTPEKFGIVLANSIGIIDESYKGDTDEWQFLARAICDTTIHKNDRICQFRIIRHQPEILLQEVETLGNSNRGGIGSTGTV